MHGKPFTGKVFDANQTHYTGQTPYDSTGSTTLSKDGKNATSWWTDSSERSSSNVNRPFQPNVRSVITSESALIKEKIDEGFEKLNEKLKEFTEQQLNYDLVVVELLKKVLDHPLMKLPPYPPQLQQQQNPSLYQQPQMQQQQQPQMQQQQQPQPQMQQQQQQQLQQQLQQQQQMQLQQQQQLYKLLFIKIM